MLESKNEQLYSLIEKADFADLAGFETTEKAQIFKTLSMKCENLHAATKMSCENLEKDIISGAFVQ